MYTKEQVNHKMQTDNQKKVDKDLAAHAYMGATGKFEIVSAMCLHLLSNLTSFMKIITLHMHRPRLYHASTESCGTTGRYLKKRLIDCERKQAERRACDENSHDLYVLTLRL